MDKFQALIVVVKYLFPLYIDEYDDMISLYE